MSQSRGRPVLRSCWNSITEIDRKVFGRQASGLLSQEGDRIGQDLVAGIELNAITPVGQDLDHKAFEMDEFFRGHVAMHDAGARLETMPNTRQCPNLKIGTFLPRHRRRSKRPAII